MSLQRLALIAWLALITALAIWSLSHPTEVEVSELGNDVPRVPIPEPSACPYPDFACKNSPEGADNGAPNWRA
jgi:hypothetical protein